MALYVDEPRWWWRGLRWAHLISDAAAAELHPVAHAVGLRRMGFQGDHYDVPEPLVDRLADHGVARVGSRELVALLRRSGLRRPPGVKVGHWDVVGAVEPGGAEGWRAVLGRARDTAAVDRIAAELTAVDTAIVDSLLITVMERDLGTVALLEPPPGGARWADLVAHLGADRPGVGAAVVVVHDRPGVGLVEVIGAEP